MYFTDWPQEVDIQEGDLEWEVDKHPLLFGSSNIPLGVDWAEFQ